MGRGKGGALATKVTEGEEEEYDRHQRSVADGDGDRAGPRDTLTGKADANEDSDGVAPVRNHIWKWQHYASSPPSLRHLFLLNKSVTPCARSPLRCLVVKRPDATCVVNLVAEGAGQQQQMGEREQEQEHEEISSDDDFSDAAYQRRHDIALREMRENIQQRRGSRSRTD